MSLNKLQLEHLLVEVSRHYSARGFGRPSISALRQMIISNTSEGKFRLQNELYSFPGIPVTDLLGRHGAGDLPQHFPPKCTPWAGKADIKSADAVFAFSFGYELTDPAKSSARERRPGTMNERLAEIVASLHRPQLPLYVQFEIARASALDEIKPTYISPVEDVGTQGVISKFLADADSHKKTLGKIIVVAHEQHAERCVRLLALRKNRKLPARPVRGCKNGWDAPEQSQPRVMSEAEYIVSDFVSMAQLRIEELVESYDD